MKLEIAELQIACRSSHEAVAFGQFSYFYGQMGAGKSSIAKLIDY